METILNKESRAAIELMVADGIITKDTAELYFPELKESGDERIMENIIATIHLYYGEPLEDEAKEMIAWLKKQSQTFTKKDVDDAYLKGICDAKHELEKQGKNNMGISEATKQKLEDNLNKALEKETLESWNKFLDEQGEQNPIDKVEPKFKAGDKIISTISNIPYYITEVYNGHYLTDVGCIIMFNAQDNFELVEQNSADTEKGTKGNEREIPSSAWSEDDETTRNNISNIIRQYDKISKRNNQPCWYVGDCLLWMQNIKGRVQPQPKQEWSKEDEKMYTATIFALAGFMGNKDKLDWLKSLKERYTWKPSNEQMIALDIATM